MIGLYFWILCSIGSLCSVEIDVVIPCHPKDYCLLKKCVKAIRQNGEGVRRVIVVTREKMLQEKSDYEVVDEEKFPFTVQDAGGSGWYYQQLLKLYAFSVIPDLTEHILILDADTIFLNRCRFVTETGVSLFTPGRGYHQPYFNHAHRLLPSFVENGRSGICNFMVMRRDIIQKLLAEVEAVHGAPLWKMFHPLADEDWKHWVGASEFEIYMNYFMMHDPKKWAWQELKWAEDLHNIRELDRYRKEGYHFVTCHHWQRR